MFLPRIFTNIESACFFFVCVVTASHWALLQHTCTGTHVHVCVCMGIPPQGALCRLEAHICSELVHVFFCFPFMCFCMLCVTVQLNLFVCET